MNDSVRTSALIVLRDIFHFSFREKGGKDHAAECRRLNDVHARVVEERRAAEGATEPVRRKGSWRQVLALGTLDLPIRKARRRKLRAEGHRARPVVSQPR